MAMLWVGMAQPASAQPYWLGLWCSGNAPVAVVAFGIDPLELLTVLRQDVPEARPLLPARTTLVQPRPGGGCAVAGVGAVRVTTQGVYTRWGGTACTPFTHSTAWIGRRRVIDASFSPCSSYGLVVTPSLVFECEGSTDRYPDSVGSSSEPVKDPVCNPLGDPRLIGRRDASMFPIDGIGRARPGLGLRYAERAGICAPFIPAQPDAAGGRRYDLAYDVFERLEFVGGAFSAQPVSGPKPATTSNEPAGKAGQIVWQELERSGSSATSDVAVSAFDFLNTGRPDAVIRVSNTTADMALIPVFQEYFIVVPGAGADLSSMVPAIEESWTGNGSWLGWDLPGAGRLVRLMKETFGAIIVRSADATDGRAPDRLKAIRHDGKTYTVAFGRSEIKFGNHLYAALSRVEPDGRLTPVCLYDRTLAPPWAPW